MGSDPVIPREGTRLGKYRLVEPAGQGGMSVVWHAWDSELKRRVALKVLNVRGAGEGEELRRFVLEARTLARLEHPNIVPIYDVGHESGIHYIAMKLIDGRTGAELAPELSPRRAAEIVRDAARGVHHIHRNGIVHRDLKPGNVMVDSMGQVYVMDFGLAQDVLRRGPRTTQAGLTVGTPTYMSPEQALGRLEELDATSDVFSLGATLYSMATRGATPFSDPTSGEAMLNIVSKDPIHPRRVRAEIPEDLSTIILHCIEKEKGRRYASAAALADDLDRFLRDEPIVATPPSLTTRIFRRARRNRAAIVVGAASAVLLAAAMTYVFLLQRAGRKREREATAERERREREDRARREGRDAALARAEALLRDARSPEAVPEGIRECVRARTADPSEGRNYWIEGRLREIAGSPAEAVEAYGAAIARRPDLVEAFRDRALLLLERYLEESGELTPFLQQHGTIDLGPKIELAVDAPAALRRVTQDLDRVRERAASPVQRAYAEAMLAAAERRPAEALDRFRECRDDPFARDGARWGAYAIYCSGEYAQAALALDRHLESRPDDAHAILLRAFCDWTTPHNVAKVRDGFERAARVDRRCTHARYSLGLLHQSQGRSAEAEVEYAAVIEMDGTFYYVWLNRGMLHLHAKDLDKALEDFERAIELRPKASLGYNRRAAVHLAKGNASDAIGDYTRAIDLNPKYFWGYFNRGKIYRQVQQHRPAIHDFTEAARLQPNLAAAYAERGHCHYALQAWGAAIEDFERAGALDAALKSQLKSVLAEAKKKAGRM
ncbi:MAG: protein kinase [Planctomycetes bacterium]|nr:protein kinase [Planctomycetota bacterium]